VTQEQSEENIMEERFIDIVCTNLPGPGDDCVFIEAENSDGEAVRLGEWVQRDDGTFALRFRASDVKRVAG
jgi:hypothetical protein